MQRSKRSRARLGANLNAKSRFQKAVATASLTACVLGFASDAKEAQAHRRDFPFTYDWYQPSKGEKEIETKSRYRGSDASLEQQVELEYGVSDRLMIAPYVVFERGRGENLRYHEWKLESRYQLGRFKTGRLLPSLYLEYARPRGGASELEGKLIFSRFNKRGDDLSVNLIAERELKSGAKIEREYSIGYARDVGKNGARLGGEWIHNLSGRRINAGPTWAFAPRDDLWLVAGYAFPITRRDNNKGELRLNLEYEF